MTSLRPPRPPATPAASRAPRTGAVIATMCLAVVLVIASVAALTPVLRTIGNDIGASQTDLQWIVDAFAVALAALLLPCGAWGDRVGRRRVMLLGFAAFVAGAAVCALATTPAVLIAGRALSGIGAAMVFPGTLATLTSSVPAERRGTAIGLWTASAALGGTIGMVVSGGLVELLDWWATFVFLGVAGALVAAATAAFVPETRDPDPGRFDVPGALLSTVGVGALVVAVIEGGARGWTDPVCLVAGAVAVVALGALVRHELRVEDPLLDMRLFALPGFRLGWVLVGAQFVVVFGFFFVAAQQLGFVEEYGPFRLAAALLPVGLLLPVASLLAERASTRFGHGAVGAAGLLLMAAASAGFAVVGSEDAYLWFAGLLVVFGIGMGLSGPPGTEAIVAALPSEKQGVASAANDVARELGGAVGIAVMGSVLTASYRGTVEAADLPAAVAPAVEESASAGLSVAAAAGDPGLAALVQRAVEGGFGDAMLGAAGLLLLAAAYAVHLGRRVDPLSPGGS